MRGLRYLILLGSIMLTPGLAWSSDNGAWQWIDGARLLNMLKEGSGLWLIDLRDQYSFAAGHIEGAINMSAEALRVRTFPQNSWLVLADDSLGLRTAKEAADTLAAKGIMKVFLLEGGVTGWKLAGHPYVESIAEVRGVTAAELKWAIDNSVALKIYDLRSGAENEASKIQEAQVIPGKSMDQRIEGLKKIMMSRTAGDRSNTRTNSEPIVLVFSAADDLESQIRLIRSFAGEDVRYLIGGYESFEISGAKYVKTLNACPTCSENR